MNQNQKISAEPHQNPNISVIGQAWCCNPPTNPCCPRISLLSDDTILIDDDYGNSIKIDKKLVYGVIEGVNKILE